MDNPYIAARETADAPNVSQKIREDRQDKTDGLLYTSQPLYSSGTTRLLVAKLRKKEKKSCKKSFGENKSWKLEQKKTRSGDHTPRKKKEDLQKHFTLQNLSTYVCICMYAQCSKQKTTAYDIPGMYVCNLSAREGGGGEEKTPKTQTNMYISYVYAFSARRRRDTAAAVSKHRRSKRRSQKKKKTRKTETETKHKNLKKKRSKKRPQKKHRRKRKRAVISAIPGYILQLICCVFVFLHDVI